MARFRRTHRETRLDFPHTCPRIDSAQDLIDEALRKHLGGQHDDLASALFDDIWDIFEGVRTTNMEMRSAADSQVEALVDDLGEKEEEIHELKERIDNHEWEIDRLRRELDHYEKMEAL